tara:strand:- start:843 stop:1367 length:525 start_codon:yes stop_codon:yes gene_type:complete
MATFTIYVPEQDPLEYALDGIEQLSIGRGPENDVVLDHVSLSGSHAVVQNLGGTFQVTDLGSTNGTFLDGEAITEGVLAHGSQVMFGSVQAVFAEAAAAEEPAAVEGDGGSSYVGGHAATVAEVSNRPPDFANLSPIEKVEKKDVVGQVATLVGVVAILAAIAVIAMSAMMTAS